VKVFYLEICHSNMLQRCLNPKDPSFRFYGGRGVKISKRWLGKHGCINFIRDVLRSIGPRPEGVNPRTGLSYFHLDRIDNSKGYERGNLRWANVAMSQKNRRPRRKMRMATSDIMFTNSSSGLLLNSPTQ
jgi:hypothetical protein